MYSLKSQCSVQKEFYDNDNKINTLKLCTNFIIMLLRKERLLKYNIFDIILL